MKMIGVSESKAKGSKNGSLTERQSQLLLLSQTTNSLSQVILETSVTGAVGPSLNRRLERSIGPCARAASKGEAAPSYLHVRRPTHNVHDFSDFSFQAALEKVTSPK